MIDRDPTDVDAEQQDPESAPAADAPSPNEAQRTGGEADEDRPPVERLDEDPAAEPDDPGLKRIKGG